MIENMTGAVHHLALTVTDRDRAREFYTGILGFRFVTEVGPKYILANGSIILGLSQPPDPGRAITNDRFDENRVGLDHVSFNVSSRDDIERFASVLEARGIPHGQITDLAGLGIDGLSIYIMTFPDPDNIQLELSAPH